MNILFQYTYAKWCSMDMLFRLIVSKMINDQNKNKD